MLVIVCECVCVCARVCARKMVVLINLFIHYGAFIKALISAFIEMVIDNDRRRIHYRGVYNGHATDCFILFSTRRTIVGFKTAFIP